MKENKTLVTPNRSRDWDKRKEILNGSQLAKMKKSIPDMTLP